MLGRWLVSGWIGVLVLGAVALPLNAQTDSDVRTEKTRRYLARLGTGKNVVVTIENGSKVKGNVLSITDESFDVRTRDHGQSTTIRFSDVKEIKRPGLSRAAKIGIVVASIAVVLIVIAQSVETGPTFR